jgi:hypothetical protein
VTARQSAFGRQGNWALSRELGRNAQALEVQTNVAPLPTPRAITLSAPHGACAACVGRSDVTATVGRRARTPNVRMCITRAPSPHAIARSSPPGRCAAYGGRSGGVGRRGRCRRRDRFPPTSVSQGWVRFVRFQEVGRTQRMTEKGAFRSEVPVRGLGTGRPSRAAGAGRRSGDQISVASDRVRASSASTPRYRTVLSSLVWPSRICTARKLPVRL